MLDLKPLLTTLSKITDNRILPFADVQEEDDLFRAVIPVILENPGDKTDQALRRYAKDWIRKQGTFSADSRFQKMRGQSWYSDEGEEIRLVGALVLTWWPRPKLSEEEKKDIEWRIDLERRRKENSD